MVLLVAWGIAQGSPLWGWYQLKTLALPGHPVQCPPTAWYKPDRHPISRAIFLRPMLSLYHSFNFPLPKSCLLPHLSVGVVLQSTLINVLVTNSHFKLCYLGPHL